jgi:hypothetical protein
LHLSINIDKIFAAGHFIGVAASFIACGKDKRIARGVNLDGAFYDAIDTDYTGKKLLLIYSDRDCYRLKNKAARLQFDPIVDGDNLRIEQLSKKANLQKLTFDLANHLNCLLASNNLNASDGHI